MTGLFHIHPQRVEYCKDGVYARLSAVASRNEDPEASLDYLMPYVSLLNPAGGRTVRGESA